MADLERARKTRQELEAEVHAALAVIETNDQVLVTGHLALIELKDRQLYKTTHKSWQAYVDDVFKRSLSTANRWIAQAREIERENKVSAAKPQVEPDRGATSFSPEAPKTLSQRKALKRRKERNNPTPAPLPSPLTEPSVTIPDEPPAPSRFVPSERRPTSGLPPNTNVTFEGIAKSEPVIPSVVALVKFLDNWPDADISALPLKDRRAVNDRMKRWMSALGLGPTSKTKVETPRAGSKAKGEKCPHPIGRRTKDGHFCYECGSKI